MPILTAPVTAPKLPVIEVADGKTAQVIGKVAQVQGEAWILRDGQKIAAAKDAPLLKGDEVETAPAAEISLVFADRSTFVLKDRGLIGLDEFSYDPATKTGSESILVAQGAFSFVSGDIAKSAPGAARLATPVMSIGVRGTTVAGQVAADGSTSVALQSDPGSSFVGEISLSRLGSNDPPVTISDAGSGVLGATLSGSFTPSSNAGAVVSSVAPPAAAPPATAPALPAAPAPSGPANAPAGGGASGGGDAGAVAAGGSAAGGGGATAPAAAPAGGGNTEAPVGPAPGGGGEAPVQVITVVEVPPLPVAPIVPPVVTIGLPGGNGGASQPLGGAPAATGGSGAAAATAEAPQQPTGTEAELGTGEPLPPPTGGTAPPPPPPSPPPPVNGGPVASGAALAAAGTEETSYTITAADLLALVSDPNGDALALTGAVTADHGSVTDNLDGTFTLTPDPDFHGQMVISYGVSDGSVTITATTLANFANTPDAPVAGSVTLPATNEDTGLVLSLAQLLGSATDADGDVLSITNLSASNGAGFTDNGNGTFTITPAANYNGTISLTYDIDDGTGNLVGTSATVVVNAVNDAPTMGIYVGQSSSTEDVPYGGDTVYTLFGSNPPFTDIDSTDTLAGVAVISNPFTADGAWQYSSDGGTTWRDISGVNTANAQLLSYTTLVRFLPAADFNGTTPSLYVYGVDSSYTGAWSNSATNTPATINASSPGGSSPLSASSTQLETAVNAVNDAPTTSAVTLAAGAEDVPYTFTLAQLLANASDVEGDSLSITSITASIGTVTNNGSGNYTLTLPQDYFGTVTFTYTISDGNSGTVAGTATTTIEDAPDLGLQAGGISFTLKESSVLTGSGYAYSGDFNNDGRLDILASNGSSGLVLALNAGMGTSSTHLFTYSSVTPSFGAFTVGDFNGDTFLDIAQRNNPSDVVDIYLGDGAGSFTLSDTLSRSYVSQLLTADFNSDGYLDLMVMRSVATGIEVFMGNGTGTFGTTPDQTPTVASPTSLTSGDIDGDGDVDVIVGVWGGDTVIVDNINGVMTPRAAVLDNHGTASPATAGSMNDVGLVDVDNDGDLDLFSANRYVEGYWYENDGTGNFTRHVVDSYTGERNNVISADFDGDGDQDILLSAYNNLQLWRNNGDNTFTNVLAGSGLPASNYTYGSSGDYDGDGDVDVALQDLSGVTHIYSNNLVGSPSFTEGGAAVSPFATLTVGDSDSANLTGATVMISVNFAPGDVLSYTSYGGIGGVYDSVTGTLALSGTASLADYQSVLRSVTFSNPTTTMGAGNRLVSAFVTDGTNSSTPITQLITVTLDATLNTSAGIDTLDGGDGANVYVMGVGEFVAGDSIADSGSAGDVDVISLTAAGTFDLSVGAVTGIEKLQMSAAGGDHVVLGGGADPQQFTSIVGGTGADSIALADGSSTLDLTGIVLTSIDSVSTGAGNDTISFDDVNFPSIGIVVDGDASAVDNDKVTIYKTQAGTLDVSASVFSNIETVALVAATGSDVVLIGNGLNNSLVGGAGSDKLTGGAGADTLTGGAGSDVFVYASSSESLDAVINRDTITDFASGTDHVRIALSGAHVDVSGFETVGSYNLGQASLTGGFARTGGVIGDGFYASGDQALYIYTGNSSSNIAADGGYVISSPNAIAAADLDFNISGTAGTDTLVGGAGNDTLIASLGGDSLTGNAGTDSFVLADNSNTTITDFTVGTDTVTLSNAEFALGSSGTLAVSDYTEGATAMSGTAFDYGATGDGLVAIQSGADVQLWSTTAMEAATTANSVLVGTLSNVNTSALDNTSFHLGV